MLRVFAFLTFVLVVRCQEFDYDEAAEDWLEDFPTCAGDEQSPINLITADATFGDFELNIVQVEASVTGEISNAGGHTYEFTPDSNASITAMNPLTGEAYELEQLHFHWDENNSSAGSEHTLDGVRYPLEVHFVFFKSEFDTIDDAVADGGRDNLMVVGQWFQLGSTSNAALDAITSGAADIVSPDAVAELDEGIDIASLLADPSGDAFTYSGSLTTPTCNEIVQWVVLNTVGTVTAEQLNLIYTIQDDDGSTIGRNWRPVQALNDRTVTRNFMIAGEVDESDADSARRLTCGHAVMLACTVYFVLTCQTAL